MKLPTGYTLITSPSLTVNAVAYTLQTDFFFFSRINYLYIKTKAALSGKPRLPQPLPLIPFLSLRFCNYHNQFNEHTYILLCNLLHDNVRSDELPIRISAKHLLYCADDRGDFRHESHYRLPFAFHPLGEVHFLIHGDYVQHQHHRV